MAGLGGGFGGLLFNNAVTQIATYNVVGALISASLGPYLQALTNQVNQLSPLVPLSPADAAEAVLRKEWTPEQAAAEARFSGVNAERFAILARLAGNAPDPGSLAVALRRKLIDRATYDRGIAQGRLRTEWGDLVRELATQIPSPGAALEAYLEGQVDEATGRQLYELFGGAPEYFDLLYNTQGQAPTPTQALELANRGLIPWDGEGPGVVSYRQAFLEGPWRNKWLGPFQALGEYLPPPRTVTAMLHEGSLSQDEAVRYLRMQGLSAELAAKYVSSGSSQQLTATKDLAQSTILALYRDQLVSRAEAGQMLTALDYSPEAADFVLQVADLQLSQHYLGLAVSRIRTLYTGHKITQEQATSALADLQVPAANLQQLIAIWAYERAANVQVLTAAQLASAYRGNIISQLDAQNRLEGLGYTADDAWLYLSQSVGKPLPRQPSATIDTAAATVSTAKTLTAAQVADSLKDQLITQDQAISRLVALGYSRHDAWLYLSGKLNAELPNEPPANA